MLAQLLQDFPEDLRIVYRNFPLISIHDKAATAAQAAEAAGLQGKFWEMHDLLFEKQDEWGGFSEGDFMDWLTNQAQAMDLDREQFIEDLTGETLVNKVSEAWQVNSEIGLPGTPFFLVNGQPYNGKLNYGDLAAVIKTTLLEKDQYDSCPTMQVDPKKEYTAIIKTDKGDITLELFVKDAPMAVNNFVFLARDGWYDGVTFHRVIPGFVAQAGDPSGTGMGSPGYSFDNETSPNLKFDKPGMLGMANAGPGTNGSQFFITYDAASHLDGGYSIFGQVISGMDVLQNLASRDPSQSADIPPGDIIRNIVIVEK